MSAENIYQILRASGLTKEGTCGLMGNMMAESSMKSNIAQRGMTSLSDEQYTAKADLGQIDFEHDSVGYGLCQWTYWSRKQKLILFAKQKHVSVGDETMQVNFCLKELKEEFPAIWNLLRSSHDMYECTRRVCIDYERPAENNIDVRYQFAQDFFNEYSNVVDVNYSPLVGDVTEETNVAVDNAQNSDRFFDLKIGIIQYIMSVDGYWGDPDGHKSQDFFGALRQYLEDMQKV